MKIRLDWHSTPQLWRAIDSDTSDGAEDSGALALMVGEGATREAALISLLEQLDEYWRGECDKESSLLSKGVRSASGCCCVFDDDGETLLKTCDAHKLWREAYAEQSGDLLREARREIEMFRKSGSTLAPSESILRRIDSHLAETESHQLISSNRDDLARVAELSENIGRRLGKRSWNETEKARHVAEIAERDVILTAVRPSYADCIALREPEHG